MRATGTLGVVGVFVPQEHELPLDEAPDAYQHFDQRVDGWTKVILHPHAA